MARKSYLSGYKDSDRRGMTVYMPDAVKGTTDLSPEAAAMHKAYNDPLRQPSLEDLHTRWKNEGKRGKAEFTGPLHEYPAELAARKAAAEATFNIPAVKAAILRKQMNDRKTKGYDIEQLMRDKMGGAHLYDDELEAIDIINRLRSAKHEELKLAKLIEELNKEIEEEESMKTSFDRRTRQLYSGLKVNEMRDQVGRLMDNLQKLKDNNSMIQDEHDYFFDTRTKKDKGTTIAEWKNKKAAEAAKKTPDKVTVIKKPKDGNS